MAQLHKIALFPDFRLPKLLFEAGLFFFRLFGLCLELKLGNLSAMSRYGPGSLKRCPEIWAQFGANLNLTSKFGEST
eukprot:2646230-Amphidinium_carterae.1